MVLSGLPFGPVAGLQVCVPDEAKALAGLVGVVEVNDQPGDAVAHPSLHEIRVKHP